MTRSGLPRFPMGPTWFDAVSRRVSRRRFQDRPPDAGALARVHTVCSRVTEATAGEVRAIVVDESPAGVFTGLVGAYGGVTGAPAFAAFVAGEDRQVDVGFIGEAVILEATAAGLDTCWIAGSFDPKAAAAHLELAQGEQVRAVTPIGYATARVGGGERMLHAVVKPRARLDLERVAPGASSWPAWARVAAEAARLAPSGGNRQPWRLRMEDRRLVIDCTGERAYWTARIDCGIAALHAELGALHEGVTGRWERLEGPGVARFDPD